MGHTHGENSPVMLNEWAGSGWVDYGSIRQADCDAADISLWPLMACIPEGISSLMAVWRKDFHKKILMIKHQ
jgi:hypothetical protein